MDSFAIDPVKAEKAMAMRRYRRIQKLARIFRCVEVFVGLVFLTWISFRLPIAIEISGALFRQLLDLVVSPRFVFLIGNAIIITLVAKSGQFSVKNSGGSSSACTDLYEEFLKTSESRAKVRTDEEVVLFQDKTVCVESRYESAGTSSCTISPSKEGSPNCCSESRVFPETKPAVERSEMEIDWEEENGEEADMSNEEFRRAVEAFIAKQQKFQREESKAIVLHGCF